MELKDIIGAAVGVFGAIPSYIMAFIAWGKWRKKNSRLPLSKWLRNIQQSYPFLLGILFSVVMVFLFVIPSGNLVLTITSPLNNSPVSQDITVTGYANQKIDGDEHLYVVVEYGGLWWPQSSEVTVGYFKTTKRYEFQTPARIGKENDTGKTFAIRAILVDSAIHQYFQNWFQQNAVTGEWSGISKTELSRIGKVKICESITVIRQ